MTYLIPGALYYISVPFLLSVVFYIYLSLCFISSEDDVVYSDWKSGAGIGECMLLMVDWLSLVNCSRQQPNTTHHVDNQFRCAIAFFKVGWGWYIQRTWGSHCCRIATTTSTRKAPVDEAAIPTAGNRIYFQCTVFMCWTPG